MTFFQRVLCPVVSAAVFAFTALASSAGSVASTLTPPQVLGNVKTMHFLVVWYENDVEKAVSEAWLAKPNQVSVTDTDRQRGGVMTVYVSDGKTQTEYRRSGHTFTKMHTPKSLSAIESYSLGLSLLAEFSVPAQFRKFQIGPSDDKNTQYARPLGVRNGLMRYEVLQVEAQTGLPLMLEITSEKPTQTAASKESEQKNPKLDAAREQSGEERFEFHGWKLNLPISPSKFAYTPPSDARLVSPPKSPKGEPVHLTLEEAIKGAVIRQ